MGQMSDAAPSAEVTGASPLAGLTVVDLSTTLAGAFATQFLADAGADVLLVEPPEGSRLRSLAAWPALARGRRSTALNLRTDAGRAQLRGLLATADVLVTTLRPGAAERLGIDPDALAALNPRLVSAEITGWGTRGPWRDIKGYEGLVMAKLGGFHAKRQATTRPGPAYISVPFASWGAGHTALHGILAALYDREASGRGQHVEADLVRGMATMDTWNWFTEIVAQRWPESFTPVHAFDDDGTPRGHLIYPLLVAPTKDGYWLQFAQTAPHLFQAMLVELGIAPTLADPKWAGFPIFDDAERRIELWELMLKRVSERTLAEWEEVFSRNPNVSAEVFRAGPDALEHPQLSHDRRIVVSEDPELGPVRQPSTLVHVDGTALRPPVPAPLLGESDAAFPGRAAVDTSTGAAGEEPAPTGLPLEGVTVLEMGLMYAAPFGTTLLTDLGARVIKVEGLDGDNIRTLVQFPEAAGAKVMQGKESIALDLTTEEGLAIVHEIARRSDLVLQSFRAGAAERAKVDPATLKAINPDLVYLSSPGYGTDGPYGARPAYAPSIGAASGIALTEAPDAAEATGSLDEVKKAAVRLNAASAVISLQADGIAAVGVASALLLGLLARRRGRPMGALTTTMIASASHAIVDHNIAYAGKPLTPRVDPGGHGPSALYRLYRASDGWVFLAAPAEHEWPELVGALKERVALDDPRFSTTAERAAHDTDLAEVLATTFATRAKDAWESELVAAGVGCVAVAEHLPERTLLSDESHDAGYTVDTVHPVFAEHRRLSPATRFSRSSTRAGGGCLAGDHTDAILSELGYDDARIADLRQRRIVS
jgi:crotonobetainyl-CoA:carnitine CoA-transferase CaiB-like acyl-CoA transferase